MRPSAPAEFNWSPDDLATFVKWRRGVLIFYSCVCFALIVTCVGSRDEKPISMAGLWDEGKNIEPAIESNALVGLYSMPWRTSNIHSK
jgi:hypothetical protein